MKTPPDPASAPPPMVLSDENREFIKNLVEEIWQHGVSVATAEGLVEKFAQDMWNAALAAQPPALEPTCKESLQVESTPPQPGDAERLAQIRAFLKIGVPNGDKAAADVRLLLDLVDDRQRALDAAQSALAASQAEVARLTEEAAKTEADLERMVAWDQRQQRVISDYAEALARLRSPAATGEDREAAIKFLRDMGLVYRGEPLETDIEKMTAFRAAARAQDVREGAENRWALDEAVIEAARELAKNWRLSPRKFDALRDALAARDAALTEEARQRGHEKTGAGDLAG